MITAKTPGKLQREGKKDAKVKLHREGREVKLHREGHEGREGKKDIIQKETADGSR